MAAKESNSKLQEHITGEPGYQVQFLGYGKPGAMDWFSRLILDEPVTKEFSPDHSEDNGKVAHSYLERSQMTERVIQLSQRAYERLFSE